MKHVKINLKLRQFPWNTYFFQIFKIDPLSVVLNHNEPGPKGPMLHGKGLKDSITSFHRGLNGNVLKGVHSSEES
jgi:hypothetical protein